jgi:hypothetical protein
VFTARYALSPYIKQIRFVFKGLMGMAGSIQGVNRWQHEFNHSPLYTAEAMNEWNYNSAPPVCLHGMDNETFTFLSASSGSGHLSQ